MGLISLDDNNWELLTNSTNCILVIGKPNCPNCENWIHSLSEEIKNGFAKEYTFTKFNTSDPGLVKFKMKNTWINQIDIFPHTVILSNGKRMSFMSGGGVERLQKIILDTFN